MKYLFLLAVLLSSFQMAGRDTPRYPVSAIPEELKKGAYAVVREDMMAFTILSKSSATFRVRMVVTIFNDKGRHFAKEAVFYDKLRKVVVFKAQVMDAEGIVIKRLKPSEIRDQSAFEGLYDDTRVKIADLMQPRYPYTVEFEYEVAYKFLYHIPGSAIDQYEDVSVEKATYELVYPEDLQPRYKVYNVNTQPEVQKANDVVSLKWSFEKIKARKFEPHSDRLKAITRIEAAPSAFEFEGYAGTMDTWDQYGKWIASLNHGRNVLPEETRAKVRQMVSGLVSREQKIKTLYEYMQNKTRYVSIQLGIGGYQPFEASVVDRTGYGDCKALSNYMLALLETVDIKGHYALIMAGDDTPELQVDFPSSQFNHAIVAVPNGADTIWLECTSQTNPFGYQGTFTGDRKALLITDNGATIVKTTRYPAETNVQATSAFVKLLPTGEATASVKRTYSGLQYENGNLHFYVNGEHDDQKKWIQNYLEIPSFDVRSFSIKNIKEKIPSAVITAELKMDRFVTVSGKRIFLTPNLMNRNTSVPEKSDNRKTDIISKVAFVDFDTVTYELPEGVYPEFVPENVTISSKFGEYQATYTVEQGKLLYIRKLKMHKGQFPASAYQELTDFYRNVSKADNTKMVFMSKT